MTDAALPHAPVVDVLVLGAGIAGVKAAAKLHEAGRSFVVLEQSHRIGGRMWDIDWGGQTIEVRRGARARGC